MAVPRLALVMAKFWTEAVAPGLILNTGPLPRRLTVITPPPSMVMSPRVFVLVTVIVVAPPHANVTVPSKLPPPGRQASNAASVQLTLVPVPTTHARAGPGTAPTPARR